MSKQYHVTTIRIDQQLKENTAEIFDELGLSMSSAITLFLKAVVREKGLPFELRLDEYPEPNSRVGDSI